MLTFSQLEIGDTFRFSSEFEFPFSRMKKGLCKKITKSKYIYPNDNTIEYTTGLQTVYQYRVGTVKTTVIKTNQ